MYNAIGSVPPVPDDDAFVLPSGEWVTFILPEDVTERQRRVFEKIMVGVKDAAPGLLDKFDKENMPSQAEMFTMFSADSLDKFNELADVSLAAVINSWSFTVPVSQDALLDLRPSDYQAVQVESAPVFQATFLNTTPQDPTDHTTPTTP